MTMHSTSMETTKRRCILSTVVCVRVCMCCSVLTKRAREEEEEGREKSKDGITPAWLRMDKKRKDDKAKTVASADANHILRINAGTVFRSIAPKSISLSLSNYPLERSL